MNINQSQLTPIERDLISRVLDFPFEVGDTTIRLNSISSKIELDLTILSYYKDEEVNCDSLTKKKEMLVEEINKLQPVMNAYMQARWKGENVKEPIHHGLPLNDYIGLLKGKVSSIDDLCKNNSKFQTPLLGSFDSNNRKVYLYLNNIEDAANSGRLNREYVLIKTFIHEMFHAWNFFACGNKERTVREIDEAMVEFATLYFLYQISITHNEFEPILNWAKRSIRSKQTAFGETAAYGYGYYLNSHVGGNEENNVLAMLEVYSSKSGNIINSKKVVLQVIGMLYPCYPYGKEWDVLMLIYQILFPGIKKRKAISRKQQIIDALRQLGGVAKLEDLYKNVDTSTWGTQTPEASIRQILQLKPEFFKIQSGVWGLEESRNEIEKQLMQGNI